MLYAICGSCSCCSICVKYLPCTNGNTKDILQVENKILMGERAFFTVSIGSIGKTLYQVGKVLINWTKPKGLLTSWNYFLVLLILV